MTQRAGATRPRQRLSEDERRRQIMRAAVEEVAERGYEGASLTAIASRAGVAKGLIWHYFSGREDLMEAAAKDLMTALSERIITMLDLDQPVPDIICATLRHAAAQLGTHRTELVALRSIVHNLQRPGEDERVTADFYTETHAGQAALFRRGQQEGTLRPFDPQVMAITYQGAIDTMLDHLDSHPEDDPEQYAAALADILLGGMLARS